MHLKSVICGLPLIAAIIGVGSSDCRADIMDEIAAVSKELGEGLNTVGQIAEKITQVQDGMAYIEKQRKGPPQNPEWQSVVKSFRDAADKISHIVIKVDFVPSRFDFPKSDISICLNKIELIKQAQDLEQYMEDAGARLIELRSELDAAKKQADDTATSLLKIQDIYVRLSGITEYVPILRDYFGLTALDITVTVMPALNEVRNLIGQKKKIIDQLIQEIGRKQSIVFFNRQQILFSPCYISGKYKMFYKNDEWNPSVIFDIQNSANSYTCVTITHPTCTCAIVSASGVQRTMVQQLGGACSGSPRYNFTISEDYRRMDEPGGVNLRLQ